MSKQISLNSAIQGEYELTADDRVEILQLLTPRCRAKTVSTVASRLKHITLQPSYDIYDRVIKEGFADGTAKWTYIAGQDYPGEIRYIREKLIKGQ